MAICLIGAGTNLPEPRSPADPIAKHGILAGLRPYQADHQMMAVTAQKAVNEALTQAKTSPDQIDLIITMGVSPSHVADDPAILGPRVGHPIQRDMGLSNAFVFDTLDGDMNFAMDLAESFFNLYPFKRALLIHSECGAPSVKPCLETGLTLSDGVSALVVSPDFSRTQMGASYIDISDQVEPLSMHPLPAGKITEATELVQLSFSAPPPLFSAIGDAALKVITQESGRYPVNEDSGYVIEDWFEGYSQALNQLPRNFTHCETPTDSGHTGPHTLALCAQKKLGDLDSASSQDEHLLLTTFNPFKMRLGCRRVRIRKAS